MFTHILLPVGACLINYQRDIAILQKLLAATKAGIISWTEDEDGEWYTTIINDREIFFRFLNFDVTNQIPSDRQMIEFHMPGRNAGFACGTKGYDILMEILASAFEWDTNEYADPLQFLDDALPDCPVQDDSDKQGDKG